jgi:two-component system sensor histidine kinase KdpD
MKSLLVPRVVLMIPHEASYALMRDALRVIRLEGYRAESLAAATNMALRSDTLLVVFDATGQEPQALANAITAIRAHDHSRTTLLVALGTSGQSESLRRAGADLATELPFTRASCFRVLNRLARIPPPTERAPATPSALEDPHAVFRRFASKARARLKIYLGAAPGVGKTFVMLREAQELTARNVKVVVGVVETHGRSETAKQLEGLTLFPRREIVYKGATLSEMDLEGLLAASPSLVLVDELAHTNVQGSVNQKRYEDVQLLTLAGIPVISTMNIQHLESLNNVIERITGVKVRETVPDNILEEAAEVVLVDISPEALQQRLRAGQIYSTDKISQSLANFFTTHNLTALRELVLRELADKVDLGLVAERNTLGREEPPGIQEVVAVAVSASPTAARVIRRAARLADRLNAPLAVITVQSGPLIEEDAKRVEAHLKLAESFEAQIAHRESQDVAQAIAEFAREIHATILVIGESRQSLWKTLIAKPFLQSLLEKTTNLDIVTVARHENEARLP